MNFLKNSIFSRGAGDSSPDWEPENENQMLAVWGSPGSGKTTTAVKLAARLAMQKKDVALLLCDMNTPMVLLETWKRSILWGVFWQQPMCRNRWYAITVLLIKKYAI